MHKYSKDIVAEVLAANDIVDVIGGLLELKPAGNGRFKALCPFHAEKTPSFHVNRDRQAFYCFGCEKGGDALGFIMNLEGLNFAEALRKLADRVGIRLPVASQRESGEDYLRTQLLEFGKFAAGFYKQTLNDPLKGGKARTYLKTRQLKPETLAQFGLGYAPEGWNNLTDAARRTGIKEAVMEASGLAKRGDRGLYDFFRNRVMIPIHDVSGNIVAFGGRDLGNEPAKYINSPENPVYKKGRVLYGLYESREALRREKRAILVEGYFDLMRCFDAGVQNVVATCGTALTSNQAALIRRYVPEVVVVYDGDAAGIRAAMRGIAILVAEGLSVRALALPDGLDPDDFIQAQGAEAFRERVDGALDFVSFYARMSAERTKTIEGRSDVAKEIFTILLGVTDEMRRDEYLKRTARELSLNEWSVRSEFGKVLQQRGGTPAETPAEASSEAAVNPHDRDFVAVILESEPMRQLVKQGLNSVALAPGPLAEVLHEIVQAPAKDVAQRLSSDGALSLYWAAAAGTHDLDPEKAEAMVRQHIYRLQRDSLKAEAQRIRQAIDSEKDVVRQAELLKLKNEIDAKVSAV